MSFLLSSLDSATFCLLQVTVTDIIIDSTYVERTSACNCIQAVVSEHGYTILHIPAPMQVDSEWNSGNVQRAHNASHMAHIWAIAGSTTGVILVFVVLFIVVHPALVVGGDAANN